MFFGEFLHQVDEKGRLRIPAKLKPAFTAKECIITKGTNGCLFVFDKAYFVNNFLNKLSEIPTFDIASQKPIRMLLSSSFEAQEDSQGRFLLPAALKEYAKISKNVVFIGVGNRLEIWSEEAWEDYKASEYSFDESVSKLSELNI